MAKTRKRSHENSKNDKMTALATLMIKILYFDDLTHNGTRIWK